jgi:biotin carboxylase
VYRANSEDELLKLVDRLLGDLDKHLYLNARKTFILAEKFVEPTKFMDDRIGEHDCEVLMWDGQVVYTNIVDNFSPAGDFFQDQAASCPTVMNAEQEDAMKKYATDCVKALGFTRGAFHVECWVTDEGPLLIEVNPRVGGGPIWDIHKRVYGVDLTFEFALAMLDVPINPPRHTAACAYGWMGPNAPITGCLQESVSFLDPVKDSLMHLSHKYFVTANASVKGYDNHVPDWLGEVHLVHDRGGTGAQLDMLIDEMSRLLMEITEIANSQTESQTVELEE